jgi:hypothetical protein
LTYEYWESSCKKYTCLLYNTPSASASGTSASPSTNKKNVARNGRALEVQRAVARKGVDRVSAARRLCTASYNRATKVVERATDEAIVMVFVEHRRVDIVTRCKAFISIAWMSIEYLAIRYL